jgi:Kef-type K+ transport system membrane component KefB
MSTPALGTSFFIAAVVILVSCRGLARLLRPLGQPPVVAEMAAGVLLGPSLLGLLAPGTEHWLFPTALRPVLYTTGQIGLAIFMFQAGHEFDTGKLRGVARSAVTISVAGITVPLALGTALAYLARGPVRLFPAGVPAHVGALFVGVTLAITAFPMLARIISERGLAGTRFGSLALAGGALDDVTAWVLLAAVIGMVHGMRPFLLAVGAVLAMAALLVPVARSGRRLETLLSGRSAEDVLLLVVGAVFLAAWFTDRAGLYAVFGAFSLGVALPRSAPLEKAVAAVGPVSRVVLVPLFFTYSGLNTDFGLLTGGAMLLFSAACVVVAVAGKFGACWLAARAAGEPPDVAVRVGTLMNARGLMQLIALNVGLAAGVVAPALFATLVLVALVTTVAATPLLTLWDRLDARRAARAATDSPVSPPSPTPAP